MKNLFVLITSISAIFILPSCEGGTTFTKSIDNRTSDTVRVKLHTIYDSKDEITINPNESKQIFWDDQMGSFVGDSYTCTQLIDSVEISITDNKVLTKDIMDSNNWKRLSEGGRNSKEDCLFIISEENIQ
jgi:hypothetical protein